MNSDLFDGSVRWSNAEPLTKLPHCQSGCADVLNYWWRSEVVGLNSSDYLDANQKDGCFVSHADCVFVYVGGSACLSVCPSCSRGMLAGL